LIIIHNLLKLPIIIYYFIISLFLKKNKFVPNIEKTFIFIFFKTYNNQSLNLMNYSIINMIGIIFTFKKKLVIFLKKKKNIVLCMIFCLYFCIYIIYFYKYHILYVIILIYSKIIFKNILLKNNKIIKTI